MQTCCAWTCRREGPRPWFIIKSWDHLGSKRVYCPNVTSFSPGKFCQCVKNWPQKVFFLLTHLNYFWPFLDFNLFISSPFSEFPWKFKVFQQQLFFTMPARRFQYLLQLGGEKKHCPKAAASDNQFFYLFLCVCKHQKICFCFGVCGCATVEWVQQSAPFGCYALKSTSPGGHQVHVTATRE